MTMVNDRDIINDCDTQANVDAWQAFGHPSLGLNDSTAQVPIYREGGACGEGQIDAADGDFVHETGVIDITGGIRAHKSVTLWLFMTAPAAVDGMTNISVGISDNIQFVDGNWGKWDFRPAFQQRDTYGWWPCMFYPSAPDEEATFSSIVLSSLDSMMLDVNNASGSQVRLFGIEQSFAMSYIGGHSQTVTLDNLVTHSKDKTGDLDLGCVYSTGSAYRCTMVIRLGDAAATALTTMSETSKVIHFDNFNSSHNIGFNFINDTGGDELHFELGDFIGGASVSGIFTFWNDGASDIFIGSANCDKFRLYAGTFLRGGPCELPPHVTSKGSIADLATIGSGGTGYAALDVLTATSGTGTKATFRVDTVASGVITAITQLTEGNYTADPTNPSATTVAPAGGSGATINITTRFFKECKGYAFDSCGEIDIGDITFEENTILNALSGVKYVGTGTRRTKNNSYIGCTDAMHFDTAQTIAVDGDIFSGNTTDVHFSGTGTLTINASGGSNIATSRVTGGGTVVINNNTSVTFVGMKDNSEVRVYDSGTGAEIAGIEDATAGTTDDRSFAWSDVASNVVDYVIHNWQPGVLTYQTIRVNNFTVPGTDVSIAIQQQVDRNAS